MGKGREEEREVGGGKKENGPYSPASQKLLFLIKTNYSLLDDCCEEVLDTIGI